MESLLATDTPAPQARKPRVSFLGRGEDYLGIFLTNVLLTVVTLGVYRPWAKVAYRKYVYYNTEFAGSRFVFTGLGSEMFLGYLKALLIFGGVWFGYNKGVELSWRINSFPLQLILFFLLLFIYAIMIPVAIHGSLRYRLSRTQWRGLQFAYVGSQKQMIRKFVVGSFFSLITFGIYLPWFFVTMYEEVTDNIRLGDVKLQFEGQGSDLFIIYLKAYFLIPLTLGIYYFWFRAEQFNFLVDYTKVIEKGQRKHLRGEATGSRMFELIFINFLMTFFTLGVGYAWAYMRSIQTKLSWIRFSWSPDVDNVITSPDTQANAVGDFLIDIGDVMIG